jgi:hypothetical protein
MEAAQVLSVVVGVSRTLIPPVSPYDPPPGLFLFVEKGEGFC